MITLEKCYLRPLESTDSSNFFTWVQDPDFTTHLASRWVYPHTTEDIASWIQKLSSSDTAVVWGIVAKDTDQLIGYVTLYDINNINRTSDFTLGIGDKRYWNKGIASEVTNKIMVYAFQSLNLHRINLTVTANNAAAIRVYEKSGFQREGIKRQAFFRDGKFYDVFVMGMLSDDLLVNY